jgi:hypothetical protein
MSLDTAVDHVESRPIMRSDIWSLLSSAATNSLKPSRSASPVEASGIAWGEPARRAAIWKVVARPNGDVYVMERKTGGYLKASLHESKVWRYAWVQGTAESSPMVQSFVEATGDRVIDRWDRPPALPGGALTIGYTIFTTGDDIRVAKDDPKMTSKVGWLPPPAVGEMGYFTIAFIRPNRQPINLRNALPVAAFAMRTGEALLVTATRRPIKPEEKEQLRVTRQKLALAQPMVVANRPDTAEPRALIHGQNETGRRHVFDFSFRPTVPEHRELGKHWTAIHGRAVMQVETSAIE